MPAGPPPLMQHLVSIRCGMLLLPGRAEKRLRLVLLQRQVQCKALFEQGLV